MLQSLGGPTPNSPLSNCSNRFCFEQGVGTARTASCVSAAQPWAQHRYRINSIWQKKKKTQKEHCSTLLLYARRSERFLRDSCILEDASHFLGTNYKAFPANACYTNVNSMKWTLAQAHDAPPKARDANAVPTHAEIWNHLRLIEGLPAASQPSLTFLLLLLRLVLAAPVPWAPAHLLGTSDSPSTHPAAGHGPMGQCHLSSRTAGTTQPSLPRTHSGRNHNAIFIASWIQAGCGLPPPPLTIPELMGSVPQQGKMCPAEQ